MRFNTEITGALDAPLRDYRYGILPPSFWLYRRGTARQYSRYHQLYTHRCTYELHLCGVGHKVEMSFQKFCHKERELGRHIPTVLNPEAVNMSEVPYGHTPNLSRQW